MKEKTKKIIKDNLDAVKDMAIDLGTKSVDLLDAAVWVSPEIALMNVANLGGTFVKERLQRMFDGIRQDRHDKKIDEEVLHSVKTTHSILDFAKFLGQENPDEEVWSAAKKIFIQTLQKDVKDNERASLYQLMNICKELSGTEIRILAGAYEIYEDLPDIQKNQRHVEWWAKEVSKNIGLETADETLRYEENLIKQRLISPREDMNGSTMDTWRSTDGSSGHRLTLLGRKLAKLLSAVGR